MEALVIVRLRMAEREPDWADSGVPDAPCPLLGVRATQSSRSALLKGCSFITVGLSLWFGGHVQETCWPSAFLHQWFSAGGVSGQETFLVVKAGERGVLPAPSAGKAGTLLKSPHGFTSQPPHLRVTPVSYDNGGG